MSIRIRVGAIIIKDESILLVKHEKEDEVYWLLPGGGVEEQETLHEALIREITEEVSLLIEPQDFNFVCESIRPGGRHVLHLGFKCNVKSGTLKVNQDKRLKGAAFFTEEQLNNLDIYPNIKEDLIRILQNQDGQPGYLGNRWH